MKGTLTLVDLKAMKPETIFATGTAFDNASGINMTNSGKVLRWVAVRGGFHDWCIYCHYADKSEYEVKSNGDKVFNKDIIRRLVPCDDEAFGYYRN